MRMKEKQKEEEGIEPFVLTSEESRILSCDSMEACNELSKELKVFSLQEAKEEVDKETEQES